MSDAKWYEIGTIVKLKIPSIPIRDGKFVKIIAHYGKDHSAYEIMGMDYEVELLDSSDRFDVSENEVIDAKIHTMIPELVMQDINNKCNSEIQTLRNTGLKLCERNQLESGRAWIDASNALENMKRMLNHYSETGEIKLPD